MNHERLVEQLSELKFVIPSGMTTRDLEGMASVLERLRAIESDKSTPKHDDEAREQYIAMLIGEKELAFRVVDIEAILDVQKITPVPGLPNFILGVCNVRGEITSVIDIQRILNIESRRQKSRRQKAAEKMVIARNNKFSVCFIVDAVLDVLRVAEPEIEKVNAADGDMERLAPFSRGVYVRPDDTGKRDVVILIDTKKLLDAPEMVQFQ
ncbi:MAG: chemotaxis protein CheW [Chloroherpetonaceae bacterium]